MGEGKRGEGRGERDGRGGGGWAGALLLAAHARTHGRTDARAHARNRIHLCTHARTHARTAHKCTHTQARKHARTRVPARKCSLARTHARKCTHVCMRARARAAHAQAHAQNRTRARAHCRDQRRHRHGQLRLRRRPGPGARARLARQNRAPESRPNSPRAPKPNPCAAAGAALDRACGCGREALEAWALAGSAYRDRWAGGSGWRGERDAVRGRIFAKPASGGPGSQNRLSEPSPTCPSLRPPSWENYGHSALNAAMRGGHRPASFPCYSRGRTPPPFSCFEVSRH